MGVGGGVTRQSWAYKFKKIKIILISPLIILNPICDPPRENHACINIKALEILHFAGWLSETGTVCSLHNNMFPIQYVL